MGRLVSIDGAHVAPDAAHVSVYDRGFLYGDSVFETIRTYGGQPFALADHMARLARSAARVGIDMPLSPADFAMEIRLAVRAAQNPESYARAMLTRGSGPVGLDPNLAQKPLRVILVEPLVPLPAATYRDGIGVITIRTAREGDAARGSAKIGNYLGSLLALREAHAKGAAEALLLDADGHVVEGTTSNVFAVRKGVVATPPDDAGLLLGITRAHLIELCAELGMTVDRSPLSPADLAGAAEVFVCSSIREIVPVVRVDGRVVGGGSPGPVTQRLHAAFRRHVGLGGAPMPWED